MAKKYTGEGCLACGETFLDDDDVVVCPDCGTPYHRDCWKKENKCINDELHESGGSWIPEAERKAKEPQTENDLRCIRCGAQNQPGQMFCGECGMPLNQSREEERPFNGTQAQQGTQQNSQQSFNQGQNTMGGFGAGYGNGFTGYGQDAGRGSSDRFDFRGGVRQVKLTEDSDIGGVRLGDYFEYAGKRSMNMIAQFIRFAKSSAKSSFNFVALFFPEYYFFYRKMHKQGLLFILLSVITMIPSLIYYGESGYFGMTFFSTSINFESTGFTLVMNVCSMVSMVLEIVAALFANYWYYKKATTDILEIRSNPEITDVQAKEQIREKGGTSWLGVLLAFTVEFILVLAFLLIMAALF
ncbi:MAG: DUF2628 domain-containing protein [Ruminococcus sp.]|nr:DUF2628 domain-containing protein [Ruminococcus sp.]